MIFSLFFLVSLVSSSSKLSRSEVENREAKYFSDVVLYICRFLFLYRPTVNSSYMLKTVFTFMYMSYLNEYDYRSERSYVSSQCTVVSVKSTMSFYSYFRSTTFNFQNKR